MKGWHNNLCLLQDTEFPGWKTMGMLKKWEKMEHELVKAERQCCSCGFFPLQGL